MPLLVLGVSPYVDHSSTLANADRLSNSGINEPRMSVFTAPGKNPHHILSASVCRKHRMIAHRMMAKSGSHGNISQPALRSYIANVIKLATATLNSIKGNLSKRGSL
jgi:hypothetical protein